MMAFIIVLHVIACVVLIILVLIQRGRGAGLVESFAGVESMFGTKTSAFLTRTTTIMSVIFFLTCLSLAVLSVKQSKSLMRSAKTPAKAAVKTEAVKAGDVKAEPAKAEAVKAEATQKVEAAKAGAVKVEAVKPAAPVEKAKPEAGK